MFDYNIQAKIAKISIPSTIKIAQNETKKLNPKIKIITISSRTGEGIEEWADWIRTEVKEWTSDFNN